MGEIPDIAAREILDSMGNPTVEAEVVLDSGITDRAGCRRPLPSSRPVSAMKTMRAA